MLMANNTFLKKSSWQTLMRHNFCITDSLKIRNCDFKNSKDQFPEVHINKMGHSLKWRPGIQDPSPRTQDLGIRTQDSKPRTEDSKAWDPRTFAFIELQNKTWKSKKSFTCKRDNSKYSFTHFSLIKIIVFFLS